MSKVASGELIPGVIDQLGRTKTSLGLSVIEKAAT
jgi:hypothetical protein